LKRPMFPIMKSHLLPLNKIVASRPETVPVANPMKCRAQSIVMHHMWLGHIVISFP